MIVCVIVWLVGWFVGSLVGSLVGWIIAEYFTACNGPLTEHKRGLIFLSQQTD